MGYRGTKRFSKLLHFGEMLLISYWHQFFYNPHTLIKKQSFICPQRREKQGHCQLPFIMAKKIRNF